ncbi:MAG: hypothetical protein R2825_08195 [Saprospiraceae bacterium]
MTEYEKIFEITFQKIVQARNKGRFLKDNKKLNHEKQKSLRNEFIRRQWLWVDNLGILDSEIMGRLPNFLKHLEKEEYNKQANDYFNKKWKEKLNNELFLRRGTHMLPQFCAAWEVAIQESDLNEYDLPHPYHPFIWLLENGVYGLEFEYKQFYIIPGGAINFYNKDFFISHGPFVSEQEFKTKNLKWTKENYPFKIFKKKIR